MDIAFHLDLPSFGLGIFFVVVIALFAIGWSDK